MDHANIPVSGGRYMCKVDIADFETLNQVKWTGIQMTKGRVYAGRRRRGSKQILMHRHIMGVTEQSKCVDHINGDSLDNRRCNLRVCTQGENMRNYRHAWGKEGIRGVMKTKTGKYRSRIRHLGKLYHIGIFDTQQDASVAYAFASSLLHGEFGSLPGHEKFIANPVDDE